MGSYLFSLNVSTEDGKYEHLRELEGAEERLEIVKADILDYQSLVSALRGCHGVFHMACLLNDDPVFIFHLIHSCAYIFLNSLLGF